MDHFFRNIRSWMKRAWDAAFPAAKRVWSGYGYYISLALLVALFGLAAYLYKNGAPLEAGSRPAAAVQTAEALPAMADATAPPAPTPVPEPSFMMPVVGEITKAYAPDTLSWNETLGQWRTHPGIDIAAVKGAAVMASEAGVVLDAHEDDIYGLVIELGHAHGYVTRYCSLATLELVRIGDSVTRGQVIGSVGSTALVEAADGPHLHFEMEYDGERMLPTFVP